jgi:hypothetical protein
LFYPEQGLFQLAGDHSFEISPSNGTGGRLEEYYTAGLFLGLVLSKSYDINAFFSQATLKQLIGSVDVVFEDFSTEQDLYKSYQWIL